METQARPGVIVSNHAVPNCIIPFGEKKAFFFNCHMLLTLSLFARLVCIDRSSHSAMFLCSSQEMTQGLYFLLLSKFKRYLGRGTNNIIELIDYSLCFSLLTIQVASFSIATNYFLYSHKKYIQFRLRLTDTVASVCV